MTKTIGAFFVCFCLLLALTACGQQFSPFSSPENKPTKQSNESAQSADDKGISSPIVAPPSYNNRPLEPGQTQPNETLPNGLPALKPLKGVNVDTLFSKNISDSDERFDRLENAVTDLRKEFEVAKPAIVRLIAVESDIQGLVEQLEVLLQQEASRPKPAPPRSVENQLITQNAAELTPTDLRPPDSSSEPPDKMQAMGAQNQQATKKMPAPKPATASSPPRAASGSTLSTIRMADHAGKTRLVLEAGAKLSYSVDIDNAENLLILTFTNGSLGLDVETLRKTSKKIRTVSSTPQNQGFVLAFELTGPTSILKEGRISPNRDNPNHRIFIDISR